MAEYIEYLRIDGQNKQVRDVEALHESDILDRLYPIGALYITLNLTNPNRFLGGSWERVEGRFLLAADDNHPIASEGGSADAIVPKHTHGATLRVDQGGKHTHTLSGTANSSGAHSHSMSNVWSAGTGNASAYTTSSKRKAVGRNTASGGVHSHTLSGTANEAGSHNHAGSVTVANAGESGIGKNMPPYLSVYVWKRVD